MEWSDSPARELAPNLRKCLRLPRNVCRALQKCCATKSVPHLAKVLRLPRKPMARIACASVPIGLGLRLLGTGPNALQPGVAIRLTSKHPKAKKLAEGTFFTILFPRTRALFSQGLLVLLSFVSGS